MKILEVEDHKNILPGFGTLLTPALRAATPPLRPAPPSVPWGEFH